jgi:UrcA family protein
MQVNGVRHRWFPTAARSHAALPSNRDFTGRRDAKLQPGAQQETRTMIRSTFLLALAAAAATASFPAYAQDVTSSTEVRYADLNLASADGAAALKARVTHAADKVCGVSRDLSLRSTAAAKGCAKIAVAKAMPQVELALAKAGTQLAESGRVTVAAH